MTDILALLRRLEWSSEHGACPECGACPRCNRDRRLGGPQMNLSDIDTPYQCTGCQAVWVVSGCTCDVSCTATHRDVRALAPQRLLNEALREQVDMLQDSAYRELAADQGVSGEVSGDEEGEGGVSDDLTCEICDRDFVMADGDENVSGLCHSCAHDEVMRLRAMLGRIATSLLRANPSAISDDLRAVLLSKISS